MAYRNKTYIAFDGDNDMQYYRLMTAWSNNENFDFDFYDAHELNYSHDWAQTESIKRQLHDRLLNSKLFILLIGNTTKRLTRFVKYEVETTIRLGIPIICVNLNGSRKEDYLSPDWFGTYPRLYISFKEKIIKYAMTNWPLYLKNNRAYGPFYYNNSVYLSLGIYN